MIEFNSKLYKTKSNKLGYLTLNMSKKGIKKISDVTGLDKLFNLQELDLSNNEIEEIEGLENLTNLKKLNLSKNNISELKGLQTLIKLTDLNLSNNPVLDWIKKNLKGYKKTKSLIDYCRMKMESEEKDAPKESQFAMGDESIVITGMLKNLDVKLDDIKSDTEYIKEATSQIEVLFDQQQDLEKFLMKRLGTDYNKIKYAYENYKNGEINKAGLIKEGLKVIGKRFLKTFIP